MSLKELIVPGESAGAVWVPWELAKDPGTANGEIRRLRDAGHRVVAALDETDGMPPYCDRRLARDGSGWAVEPFQDE